MTRVLTDLVLQPIPSTLQALPIVLLVALLTAREVRRALGLPVDGLGRATAVLTPVVIATLGLRLVVIMQ